MAHEPRVFGYARVSTEDQDLRLQRQALLDYGVDPEFIVDEKGSGKTMDRKQWNRIMKALRSRDKVVVWKFDRLGRTLTGVLDTMARFKEVGAELVSIRESFDTTQPMGKAMLHIALVFAELERDLTAERTKAAIAARKAAGVRFGPVPAIEGNLKRIRAWQKLYDEGLLPVMTAKEIVAVLNRADPASKPIGSPETYRNWKRKGHPGAMLDAPEVDGPLEDGE